MKIKVLCVFMLLLILFGICGCTKKNIYGSPSEHKCINCDNYADHYLNKWTNSKGESVDLYLCDECYKYRFDEFPVNDSFNGKKYPWVD